MAISRSDRWTRQGIAIEPLAVYILEHKGQDEGVGVMVQRREMIRTAVALQGIKYKPRVSEPVSAIASLVVGAGEVWSKLGRLQAGPRYTLEMYDRVLT